MTLALNNICFGYGESPLLDNVSLTIEPAQVLGILGPNGAGKSSLLRLMNGRLQPDGGDITLEGRTLASLPASTIAQRIAMISQNPAARFGFPVEDVVAMGRRPYQGWFGALTESDHQAIETALTETGLTALRSRPITHLSGGELQLTFVARALAQDPDILLMDEATSSLDIRHTARILSLVRRRVRQGELTVVAVIHDLNLAAAFCDRIAFLSQGRLIGPEAPATLIDTPMLVRVYEVERERIQVHRDPLHIEFRMEDGS